MYVIDLWKGPKGSAWVNHKYIARVQTVDGTWHYIYPGEQKLNEKNQLVLGKHTPAQIINNYLFGGPTGKFNKRTGAPIYKDGLFISYGKPHRIGVQKVPFEGQRDEGVTATKEERTPRAGEWRVEKFQKIKGYTHIELHPALTQTMGYRLSQQIKDLHLDTPEKRAAAEAEINRDGAPVQPVPVVTAPPREMAATAPLGETGIHAVPKPTPATAHVLDVETTEDIDPVVSAQTLLQRWFKRKKPAPDAPTGSLSVAPGEHDQAARVEPFPEWMLKKFANEQEMIDKLQYQPATTAITLGQIKPTRWSGKLNKKLLSEWYRTIARLASHDFDAMKLTMRYDKAKVKDDALGIDENHPESAVSALRKKMTNEWVQEGQLKLLEVSRKYKPDRTTNSNFAQYAYTAIKNHLTDLSKKKAEDSRTALPIVHEEDVDEAARKMGSQYALTPEEHHELAVSTEPAKAALLKIINDPTFPETYRRVFLARLWLDDPKALAEEDLRIRRRKDARAEGQPTEKVDWKRDFTGSSGVAKQYATWIDPETNRPIEMSQLSADTQRRYLSKWYDEAQRQIFRQLSVEGRSGGGRSFATKHDRVVDHAAAVAASAIGKNPELEDRTLTHEGHMVQRWLELESKLAHMNRRTHNVRETHALTLQHIPKDNKTPIKTVPLVEEHPALAFFTHTKNQKLAQQLGLNLHNVAGVRTQRNISSVGSATQHHINAANAYHATLKRHAKLSTEVLTKRTKELHARHKALHALSTQANASGHKGSNVLSALHHAASQYQGHVRTLEGKLKEASTLASSLRATGTTRKEIQEKVKAAKPTAQEMKKLSTLKNAYVTHLSAVEKLAPTVAATYEALADGDEAIGDHHLQAARAAVNVHRQKLRNELTLLEYEKQRRTLKKSLTVGDFARTLDDYCLAIGQLHAELF